MGCRGRMADLQLTMKSVPIITNVACSNPAHGDVYSLHYVTTFVSDLRKVCGAKILNL